MQSAPATASPSCKLATFPAPGSAVLPADAHAQHGVGEAKGGLHGARADGERVAQRVDGGPGAFAPRGARDPAQYQATRRAGPRVLENPTPKSAAVERPAPARCPAPRSRGTWLLRTRLDRDHPTHVQALSGKGRR